MYEARRPLDSDWTTDLKEPIPTPQGDELQKRLLDSFHRSYLDRRFPPRKVLGCSYIERWIPHVDMEWEAGASSETRQKQQVDDLL